MVMKNPPHPGEVVRDAIKSGLGLTVTAAAEGLGVSRKRLSQILNDRTRITPEMAIRLDNGHRGAVSAYGIEEVRSQGLGEGRPGAQRRVARSSTDAARMTARNSCRCFRYSTRSLAAWNASITSLTDAS